MYCCLSILRAAEFAAEKHKSQRRKADNSPYINHPLGVAYILIDEGGVSDTDTLVAAILHDTIEDTDTTYTEIVQEFGVHVADIVLEVTDDKTLNKEDRKRAQIVHVATVSTEAKMVKVADKLYNCRDLLRLPPPGWSAERVQGYIVWSKAVLSGTRGLVPALDEAHDLLYSTGTFTVNGILHNAIPDVDEKVFLENYLQTMRNA